MPRRNKLSLRLCLSVICLVTMTQLLWWNRQTHLLDDQGGNHPDVNPAAGATERRPRRQQQQQSSARSTSGSIAIVVAGSAQRLLFNSTVQHVIKPLVVGERQYQVDYFAAITLQSGPAFRQASGYMGHLGYEHPLLESYWKKQQQHQQATTTTTMTEAVDSSNISRIQSLLQQAMSNTMATVSPSAKLQSLRVLAQPIEDDPILDSIRQRKKNHNNQQQQSIFDQFPMMDQRPEALERTQAGNKNMIRLFLLQQLLWQDVERAEQTRGSRYDYILLLRDDALWLENLHLDALLQTNPQADAYILSCDARTPAMLPPEINDHGMLIKRDKADIVGKYVSTLVEANLQKCHDSVTKWLGKERGCNSEMILKHILKEHHVTVQLVSQSLLPFERAVVVEHATTGRKEYCFHKYCQSKEQPLDLPPAMRKCADITSFN